MGGRCAPRPSCRPRSIRARPGSTIPRSAAGSRACSIAALGSGRRLGAAARAPATATWRTERWKLRREQLFLLPGDSPIGLRLPLGSLAGAPPPVWAEARRADPRRDARRSAAEQRRAEPRRRDAPPADAGARSAPRSRSSRATASCGCSCRRSRRFDDFCALVARDRSRARRDRRRRSSSKATARRRRRSCARFAVTPDPGVLEVNLPPVATLPRRRRAARDRVRRRARERASPPSATCSTAAPPARAAATTSRSAARRRCASPWLARPDLLASLVTFAQHHPSLSYMFTGLFVGPTSQAPRVDEARHDALYELELALPRLYDAGAAARGRSTRCCATCSSTSPGSTHRAEISIDKLFDPRHAVRPARPRRAARVRDAAASAHGRRAGRARARAGRRVRRARRTAHALVRWGSRAPRSVPAAVLHVARLRGRARAPRARTASRCPPTRTGRSSSCAARSSARSRSATARVEVRNAIEPWHVLGEEATQHRHRALRRLVDRAARAARDRPRRRALRRRGQRRRAADAPRGRPRRPRRRRAVPRVVPAARAAPAPRHPSPAAHRRRSTRGRKRGVAGGAYHVWHPEGRAFDAPPLTRVEAEARRAQRFTLAKARRRGRSRVAARRAASRAAVHARPAPLDAGTPMPRAEDWGDPADRTRAGERRRSPPRSRCTTSCSRGAASTCGSAPSRRSRAPTRSSRRGPSAAEGDDKLARAHALADAARRRAARRDGVARRRPAVSRRGRAAVRVRRALARRRRGRHARARSTRRRAPPTELGGDRWLTVTPDPGVVEVNMAPCATRRRRSPSRRSACGTPRAPPGCRRCAIASTATSPIRAAAASSRSAARRPEHVAVRALPARAAGADPLPQQPPVAVVLVRERVRRLGVAGAAPRRGRARALGRARASRSTGSSSSPIAASCRPSSCGTRSRPLLVDASGNSHRAELNVEKLWNPHIARARPAPRPDGRRRAARDPHARAARHARRARRAVALDRRAARRRRTTASRSSTGTTSSTIGSRCRPRSQRDLRLVLGDLDEHGLGVPAQLRARARGVARARHRLPARRRDARAAARARVLAAASATSRRRSAPARAGRRVDPALGARRSTAPGPIASRSPGAWAQLRALGDGVRAIGVRRRVYQPSPGLHPGLPRTRSARRSSGRGPAARSASSCGRGGRAAAPYPGLPARRRRRARAPPASASRSRPATASVAAAGFWREARPFTIDLRRAQVLC